MRGAQNSDRNQAADFLRKARAEPLHADEVSVLGASIDCAQTVACALGEHLSKTLGFLRVERVNVEAEIGRRRRKNQGVLFAGAALAAVGLAMQARRLQLRRRALKAKEGDVQAVDELLRGRLEELYQLRMSTAEANRFAAYGELAAGFSHRIKTPLAGIRMSAQLAQRKLGQAHGARPQLDDIISEADRLLAEVRRFLSATRTGELKSARTSLQGLGAGLVDEYQALAQSRTRALTSDIDEGAPMLKVDAALIEMGLRNLIENALEAPGGTSVVLRGMTTAAPPRAGLEETAPSHDAWVEFAVSDDGTGLPESVYRNGAGHSTKENGSGLGLAITRRICARHGGALLVESSSAGTTARMVLPADPEVEPSAVEVA